MKSPNTEVHLRASVQASISAPPFSYRHDGSGLRPERSPLRERRSFPAEPPLQMHMHRRSHRLHSRVHPEARRNLRPGRTDGQQASRPSRWAEEAPARHELHVRWVFTELTCEEEQVSLGGGTVGFGFLNVPFFLDTQSWCLVIVAGENKH